MKKLFVASMLVVFSYPILSAQEPIKDTTVVITPTQVKDEFIKIDIETLPLQVQAFITKTYPESSIKKAFELIKDSDKIYKVIILTKEGKEIISMLNAKGEAIN
jgi:hypothetical protein